MAVEVRQCGPDELRGALDPIWHYFGGRARAEDVERFAPILPPERVLGAFDGDAIVGGGGAYLFQTTVPGGTAVPTAGVMAVGVLPTHRRRGVLTKLMRRQLADAHERGEPLALLYASEGQIYSRFGYGLASIAGNIELPKEHARLWDDEPIGQARLIESEEESLELLPPIYDRVQAETVGMITRTADWWRARRLYQRPGSGGEQMRVAIDVDGDLEAYALYRLNFAARHMVSESTLVVTEALGTSPRALAAIWRYLLGIDWVARIDAFWLPLDHPLFLSLREPRRMRFSAVEGLWVRLVDVGAALEATRSRRAGNRAPRPGRVLPLEPRPLANRRRGRRPHDGRGRPEARCVRARFRVPGGFHVRPAEAGRATRGAEAGRRGSSRRALPHGSPAVVPRAVLTAGIRGGVREPVDRIAGAAQQR